MKIYRSLLNIIKRFVLSYKHRLFFFLEVSIYLFTVTSLIMLPIMMYYTWTNILPLVRYEHILLTNHYGQIFLWIIGIVLWAGLLVYRRTSLTKSMLAMFGPVTLAGANLKFIYLFHSTRSLFEESFLFKSLGISFSHVYTRDEFLVFGEAYLKAHDALNDLYLLLPSFLDSCSCSTMKEWTELLEGFIASFKSDSVECTTDPSASILTQIVDTMVAFPTEHPYICLGVIVCVSALVLFGIWYFGCGCSGEATPATVTTSPVPSSEPEIVPVPSSEPEIVPEQFPDWLIGVIEDLEIPDASPVPAPEPEIVPTPKVMTLWEWLREYLKI